MIATRWLRIKARAGRVLLACLVLCAVAGVFWYRQLEVDDRQQAPPGVPVNDTNAEMVIRDFRHVETRMDRTIWILESDRAEIVGDIASLSVVKVTWYGDLGATTVVITSAAGTVDFRRRKAEFRGDVRVERADGAALRTEELVWDERTKFLQAPLPVVISTPNFTFRGESLEADLATERVILRGPVQGEVLSVSRAGPRPS